jgi:carbonic anhydrase/acetyltransferase-like protein (isoleucine patch superfamily)
MTIFSLEGDRPAFNPGSCWIAPDAVVIGRVELGDDASIWFGSVLRGDNEYIRIGARTNVQEHCIFHTDIGFELVVGEGCVIGHRSILHGCTVGDNTLIGMGAIVMNGARIGRNCIIGAGALVTEGKIVPDNSLVVGAPGKIIKQVSEAAALRTQRSAEGYVEKWKRCRVGLTIIG